MLAVYISNFYLKALLHNVAIFEHEVLKIAVANLTRDKWGITSLLIIYWQINWHK